MASPIAVLLAVHTGCLLLRSSRGFQGKEEDNKAGVKSYFILQKSPMMVVFSAGTQAAKPGWFCRGAWHRCAEPSRAEQQQHLHRRVGPSNSPVLAMGRSAIIHLLWAWRGSWRRFAQQPGPRSIRVLPSIAAAPRGILHGRCACRG